MVAEKQVDTTKIQIGELEQKIKNLDEAHGVFAKKVIDLENYMVALRRDFDQFDKTVSEIQTRALGLDSKIIRDKVTPIENGFLELTDRFNKLNNRFDKVSRQRLTLSGRFLKWLWS